MFNLLKDIPKSYDWPVTLEVPVSNKKFKKINFHVEFARLSKTESNNMLELARETDESGNMSFNYQTVFDSVLIDIKAKDDTGKLESLPEEIKEELLEMTGCELAIFRAYSSSLVNEKTKN